MRLVTIRFSHYCEKARWALDRYGVPYDEDGHLPGFHVRAVKKVTRGEKDSVGSAYSTPVLVTDDDDVLTDSRAIVRWASDRFGDGALYPSPEVDAWEERFHDRLGFHSRRLAYAFLFQTPSLLADLARANVGGLSSRVFSVASPLIAGRFQKAMGIDENTVEQSLAVVREELDVIDALLADGRRFLVGDSFTAADLAFACAAAPAVVVQPDEGFGAVLPAIASLPDACQTLAAECRARPGGELALRLFATERGERIRPYGEGR